MEAILICVPTPLDDHREPDLSFVLDTAGTIAPHLATGVLVTLESTTHPGTTEDELRLVLEKGSGMLAGIDFHLAYSPEREDPGREMPVCDPKVVGGLTPKCGILQLSTVRHWTIFIGYPPVRQLRLQTFGKHFSQCEHCLG